jgi:hypothetical protein
MSALTTVIRDHSTPAPHPAVLAVVEELRGRFPAAMVAVLYYGSCLRQGDPTDGVIDLYVVVRDYRSAFDTVGRRLIAGVLPPTVGYLETPWESGVIRTKYAVISLRDFQRGTSRRWFHSYLWGRFSQPCVVLAAQDDDTRSRLEDCLGRAVGTLLDRTLPLCPSRVTASGLWAVALGASYRAELRPESAGRAEEIVAADAGHYAALTRAYAASCAEGRLAPATHGTADNAYEVRVSGWARRRCRTAWFCRRLAGKLLSTGRWFKAAATFEGGIDYAVWKLERHTGHRIEVSDKLRRRPWLYAWGEIIRLYRSGTLR